MESAAQGIAERVIDLVVQALDVNALLLRIDMNDLVERVDVDALVEQTDLGAVIAGASGGLATDALDEVRILVQREHRALHDFIAGTVVIYAWDARAARLRFLAREPVPSASPDAIAGR